ncbi:serine-rich adhesin for platelets isoform X2 [Thalassophryne amazonica]|uniref:serine-rich adhesin for platelets isoform X2 n=1 Tax=Thalassophryne amazonica TaxID=390379 RepID=UPI001471D702|nr:serine-rich adhesin for platelets isoform X2 [Thalassophryne amazonica]
MSQDFRGSSYGSSPSELRLVLLGNIGCGKTSSGDTILSQVSPILSSGLSGSCQVRQGFIESRRVTLVEAPRWYWNSGHMEATVRKETERAFTLVAPGPHAILVLVPVGQFTELDSRVPAELKEVFGEEVLDHTMVLLTCGDYLMGRTLQEYLQKENPGLRQIIDQCGGRCHVINNRQRQKREQVSGLFEMVENMVQKHGIYYPKTWQEREMETQLKKREQELEEKYRVSREEKKSTTASTHIPCTEIQRNIEKEDYGVTMLRRRAEREEMERTAVNAASNGLHSKPQPNDSTTHRFERTPSFKLNADGAKLSQMSEVRPAEKIVTTFHHRLNSLDDRSPEASPTSSPHSPVFSSSSYYSSQTGAPSSPSSYFSSKFDPSSYSSPKFDPSSSSYSSQMVASSSSSSYSSPKFDPSSSSYSSQMGAPSSPSSYSSSKFDPSSSSYSSSKFDPSSSSYSSQTVASSSSSSYSSPKFDPSSSSYSSQTDAPSSPSSYSSSKFDPSSSSYSSQTVSSSYSSPKFDPSSSSYSSQTDAPSSPSSYSSSKFDPSSSSYSSQTVSSSYSSPKFDPSSSSYSSQTGAPSSSSSYSSSKFDPSSSSYSSQTVASSSSSKFDPSSSSYSSQTVASSSSSSKFDPSFSSYSSRTLAPSSSSSYSPTVAPTSSSYSSTFAPSSSSSSKFASSSSPELRLVLLGRSGSGKSTAGNSILGQAEFASRPESLTAVTQECEKKKALVAGRKVALVDTPDWFSSEHTPDEVRAQISSCVTLSSPGPHAFLYCVPVDQPAKTDLQALEALEIVFGPEAVQRHTMVLFTHADRLKESGKTGNEGLEAYISNQRQDLLTLVEKCGDRFHVMERGRGRAEKNNVEELLEKVEQTVNEAGGHCYSCPAFQEAEKKVRQRQLEMVRDKGEKCWNRNPREKLDSSELKGRCFTHPCKL